MHPVRPLALLGPALAVTLVAGTNNFFGIHVIDDQTGRGVPLVQLETVDHVRFLTDSGGWVAIAEPGLMGQPIFFQVWSHGYEFPKDGFGYAGVALTPRAGGRATLRLKRVNVAERLYRLTGEGLYRDSVLLGEPTPLRRPLGAGGVVGQDSADAAVYRGKVYWVWGDTLRFRYPLGNFWSSGATSALPGSGGLDPGQGVNYQYFTNADGFCRPMCHLGVKSGLMWLDGLVSVPDQRGEPRLLAHYSHMESLAKMLDHGLAVWNDRAAQFEPLTQLPLAERWRFPHGHPTRGRGDEASYLYSGDPFLNVRVAARLERVCAPASYEVWTCLAPGEAGERGQVQRDGQGALRYEWRRAGPPVNAARERQLWAQGLLKPEELRYQPLDVDTGKRVRIHGGSVFWNEYRGRWILIAVQQEGTSYLGEVYYAEAPAPTGPWPRAKKIVTHSHYTFYNPVQHPFFDQGKGRWVYFEGTYANTFSGNPVATPRYDYNQMMYRLDLDDPRLR